MNVSRFSSLPSARRPRRRAGMSLVEIMVGLSIVGLVLTAATRQMIEGVKLSMKTAQTLEFESSSRRLIDRMAQDVRSSELVVVLPSFDDRTSSVGDGNFGNYVVLHQVAGSGTITRTIGYYLRANADGSSSLFRHDSEEGALAPGELPASGSAGAHLLLVSTVRVPADDGLFRAWRNRGFTVRGQFGTPQGASTGRLEYVQCSLTTRG